MCHLIELRWRGLLDRQTFATLATDNLAIDIPNYEGAMWSFFSPYCERVAWSE